MASSLHPRFCPLRLLRFLPAAAASTASAAVKQEAIGGGEHRAAVMDARVAGRNHSEQKRSMPPHNANKNGGSFGRAASGVIRRDGARAEELRMPRRGLVLMSCTIALFVLRAPDLWPQLFGP